ncbi:MAG: glycosyltransferase family 39 protein [Deltaproteobacteria bacterium]|nr:glycosyltransferase family 39 protein [Deltaproteobacteria bacterium]
MYALAGFFIYMTTPLVFNLARMAYIDHGAAFYSMLSFMAALRFRDEGSLKWLAVSAMAMGLGLGAKYNVLLSFFLIGLFITAVSYKDKGISEAIKKSAFFVAVALAVLSPWLIRNYAWTGSPFYPLFETAAASVARGEGLHVTGEMAPVGKRFILYGEGALDLIILPLRLFWEGADNSIQKFDGVLNPMFLAFIPLAFLRKEKDTKLLLAFSILFFALAAFTVDLVTMYLMPVIPVVIILVTLGIRNGFGSRLLKWPAVIIAVALVAFNVSYGFGLYKKTGAVNYFAGGMDREGYLKAALSDYNIISFGNGALPQDARVMLLFTGDKGYYWDREYIYGDRTGVFLNTIVKNSHDATSIAAGFRNYGATHLMVNEALFQKFANDNFTQKELEVLVSFLNTRLHALYSYRGYSLYEIRQ